uniref:DNA-directed RNA polymerase n=1 Tax=Meloidogyne hapla TaxID=6305 RepID=A0A1I8BSG0_MELHA
MIFERQNHNKTKYEKKLLEGRHELSERYQRDLVRILYSFRPIHCRIFASTRVVQDPIYIEPDIITATRGRRKTVGALEPMDINGKPLISDAKKEDLGRAYFKQLAMSWE